MKNLRKIGMMAFTAFALQLSPTDLLAKVTFGGDSGGGGDATELRVDEIRADILSWIKRDGAKGLNLPAHISYEDYTSKMEFVLAPYKVTVNFVEADHATDEELQVNVNGKPKTCRGFISKTNQQPHILCNINRFLSTKEADQYQLIHHEFAGLVKIENNIGAKSDYAISNQLSDFLTFQRVLKLAVKEQKREKCNIYSETLNQIIEETENSRFGDTSFSKQQVEYYEIAKKDLLKKGYQFTQDKSIATLEMSSIGAFYSEETMCTVGQVQFTDLKTNKSTGFHKKNCGLASALFETGKTSALKKALAQIPACK